MKRKNVLNGPSDGEIIAGAAIGCKDTVGYFG